MIAFSIPGEKPNADCQSAQSDLPLGLRRSRARQSRPGRTIAPRLGESSHIVTVEPWRPPQTQGAGAIAGLKSKFGGRLRIASRRRHHHRPS